MSLSPKTFSVKRDDPFIIFQILQDIAREARGENNVIDLSRGDPGFGFTPSVHGRRFASFILFLDSILNANAENRFLNFQKEDLPKILKRISEITKQTYAPDTAEALLRDLKFFLKQAKKAAETERKAWDDFTVLTELFSYCRMSGGSYLHPRGETLTRVIVASWHKHEYSVPIASSDLILTSGASHAIGTVFKALGEEGCGFLRAGDQVAIASPVYSPYMSILAERGIGVVPLPIDPYTGKLEIGNCLPVRQAGKLEKGAQSHTENSDPKALILIDPNNPTGFSLSEKTLRELAEIARAKNMLVITDEVYSSFFPKKKNMLALCPERTICINARSKIERSTGLRFGEIIILPEGRETIASLLKLENGDALMKLLTFAKAPGRTGGQFQHTTFVPGPSQLLGISHIIFGGKEREVYKRDLKRNCAIFAQELSLKHRGNLYYVIFDLDTLPGCRTSSIPIEKRLRKLARAGVVYVPAYRFFSESDRPKTGVLTSVRASVVNTTPERLREAARRTKEVLC